MEWRGELWGVPVRLEVITVKPDLYTRVVLRCDVPSEDLKCGDLAWVVEYLEHPNGGEEGAILEIFNVLGESLRIATVPVSAIATAQADQAPMVRALVASP
jgi:hypothetical protein